MFWHVHYLPDGLTDGREQMLSFVQTVTLPMSSKSPFCHGHFVSMSHRGCFHPFMVEQKASTGVGGAVLIKGQMGGMSRDGVLRAVGPTVGRDLNTCVTRCVCVYIYMHTQLEGVLLSCSRGLSWCNLLV